MPYEIWWALVVLVGTFGWLGLALLRTRSRERHRLRLREMVHAERLAALERGVPPIEWPDPAIEIAALEADAEPSARARPLVLWGIVLTAGGAGVSLAFLLAGEDHLNELWPLGLVGVLVGIGLLLTHVLTPNRRGLG